MNTAVITYGQKINNRLEPQDFGRLCNGSRVRRRQLTTRNVEAFLEKTAFAYHPNSRKKDAKFCFGGMQ